MRRVFMVVGHHHTHTHSRKHIIQSVNEIARMIYASIESFDLKPICCNSHAVDFNNNCEFPRLSSQYRACVCVSGCRRVNSIIICSGSRLEQRFIADVFCPCYFHVPTTLNVIHFSDKYTLHSLHFDNCFVVHMCSICCFFSSCGGYLIKKSVSPFSKIALIRFAFK